MNPTDWKVMVYIVHCLLYTYLWHVECPESQDTRGLDRWMRCSRRCGRCRLWRYSLPSGWSCCRVCVSVLSLHAVLEQNIIWPFPSAGTSKEDNGAFADYARFDTVSTLKLPQGMTHEEGASLPVCLLPVPSFAQHNSFLKYRFPTLQRFKLFTFVSLFLHPLKHLALP